MIRLKKVEPNLIKISCYYYKNRGYYINIYINENHELLKFLEIFILTAIISK